jgi:putative transposase
MARQARMVVPEFPHHITQRGVRSMDVFYAQEDYELYLQILKEQSDKFGLKVLAYCLMKNHIHLIVVPQEENSLAKAIGETHKRYTRKINFEQNTKGYLFQGRFFSSALDESYFYNCLKYVEQNPVKANIVSNAWDYKYSSTRIRMELEKDKLNLLSNHEWIPSINEYQDYITKSPKSENINFIEEKTRTGRPCGDDKFYEHIKKHLGKDYKPKKPGPKQKKTTK